MHTRSQAGLPDPVRRWVIAYKNIQMWGETEMIKMLAAILMIPYVILKSAFKGGGKR